MSASLDIDRREGPRRSRWVRWLGNAALVAAVYLALAYFRGRSGLPTDGDTPAPAFTLRTLDGQERSLADLAGKTVLLHFWAPWCGICRAEVSTLNAVKADLAPDQALLTVAAADDVASVREFMRERELAYPVVMATPEVLAAYGVSAFPTNYVIDARGRIRSHTVGMTTRWGLKARLGCSR
ncbi:MAG TPA: TlpA disulfide reductase family protein [Polyangiaceae bacterium]